MSQDPLTKETMQHGIEYLVEADADLARLVSRLGSPPLWARAPGFPTLVHIILEQQVSLASARAAYNKLAVAAGSLSPGRFLEFSDTELKGFGFSRQKTRYCRVLARAILNGDLDLTALEAETDQTVRAGLTAIKGIGPWTADIYLLMALLRPDVWPAGDLALAVSIQKIKGLPDRPDTAAMNRIASRWSPWRAVAARILWHDYLNP
jgi:DNA-3-methyladenine glycosylase II